jgi:hypothetical protein
VWKWYSLCGVSEGGLSGQRLRQRAVEAQRAVVVSAGNGAVAYSGQEATACDGIRATPALVTLLCEICTTLRAAAEAGDSGDRLARKVIARSIAIAQKTNN